MLALCLMLLGTYYALNYTGIIGQGLEESIADFVAGLQKPSMQNKFGR